MTLRKAIAPILGFQARRLRGDPADSAGTWVGHTTSARDGIPLAALISL